jgi:peptidoglycan hydrolase-like protein with peptidoglycan-binding domain
MADRLSLSSAYRTGRPLFASSGERPMSRQRLLAGVFMLALASPFAVTAAEAQSTAQSMPYSTASVQSVLNDLGYSAGPVDGLMGGKTRGAIRAYQTDSGLPASGEPSLALYEHLQDSYAQRYAQTAPPAASTQMITEIQGLLRQRGYDVPDVTGTVDTKTAAAIRSYQVDASLPADAIPSEILLASLKIGTDTTVSSGLNRAQIAQLQAELSDRGYDPGPQDGIVGPKVRTAIRTYQTDAGLPATGEATVSLLAHIQNATADANAGRPGDNGPNRPRDNHGPQWGNNGSNNSWNGHGPQADQAMTQLEGELQRRMYYVGEVDGEVDEQTRAAIRAYQRDTGLPVTGQPSAELAQQLRTSNVRNRSETTSLVVWAIENELARRDFYVGSIDGTVDTQTRTAIKLYQRMAGIDHNGKASYPLLQNIERSNLRNTGEVASVLVWQIEGALTERGYRTGPIDGSMDPQTNDAVRHYQQDAGLPTTGRTDKALLASIEQSDKRQVSQRDIQEIERRLDRRAYHPGRVDGVADAQTAMAISAYQTDADLPVTGRASVALLEHLRSSNVRSTGEADVNGAIQRMIESFAKAGG